MIKIELNDEIKNKNPVQTREYLKDFYNTIYRTGRYRPINSYGAWLRLFKGYAPFIRKKKPFIKGIEIGCGIGLGVSFANALGHDVWGLDLADATNYWKLLEVNDKCLIASALNIPFKNDTFDFVFVPDVMEHIPKNDVLETLKEIKRIGSKQYFFIIHTTNETEPMSLQHEGEEVKIYSHITREGAGWWGKKIKEAGYGKIDFTIADKHVVFICTKHKGDQI